MFLKNTIHILAIALLGCVMQAHAPKEKVSAKLSFKLLDEYHKPVIGRPCVLFRREADKSLTFITGNFTDSCGVFTTTFDMPKNDTTKYLLNYSKYGGHNAFHFNLIPSKKTTFDTTIVENQAEVEKAHQKTVEKFERLKNGTRK